MPQVKRSFIISNKNDIHVFSREFPNDVKLTILQPHGIFAAGGANAHTRKKKKAYDFRKLGHLKRITKLLRAWTSFQNENFVNTSKKNLKNRNWTFPAVRYDFPQCSFAITRIILNYTRGWGMLINFWILPRPIQALSRPLQFVNFQIF